MPLINYEMNFMLNWSANCFITTLIGAGTFAIRDTKLYISLVTLSTQDHKKLVWQLKSGLKRRTSRGKCQSKVSRQIQYQHLDYLSNPSFHGANILFVLLFEDSMIRTERSGYFLPNVEIKEYNVNIDGQDFIYQSVKTDIKTMT